jgi:hypothetical protein
MQVTEVKHGEYRVELTDEEYLHFSIIGTGLKAPSLTPVSTVMQYILAYSEQRWYLTIEEPATDGH